MIELFPYNQIRCKHCEFEFSFSGFGSAAKIVCPACGEENVLETEPIKAKPIKVEEARTQRSIVPEPKPVHDPLETIACSVEYCPLLTGESDSVVAEVIAEQMGLRLQEKRKRRRTILAWTVTLQASVLIGAALFALQTLMVSPEQPIIQSVNVTETPSAMLIADTLPDVFPPPLPAVPEIKVTAQNSAPEIPLFEPIKELEHAVSPFELAQNILAPPVDVGIVPPSPDYVPEIIPPLPLPKEPVMPTVTLAMADSMLESAKSGWATNPERSAEQAVRAAKIYEELGFPLPHPIYWILSSTFASLSWGEPLLESAPAIETMTLSSDSRWLLVHLRDKTVWLWDLHSLSNNREGFLLDSGTAEYVKFVFTPDLRWVIGGQKNGTIRIWDMSLRNPGDTMIAFSERIPDLQDLQISPDGQWLAAFGNSPQGAIVSADPPSQQLTPGQPIQQVNYQRSDRFLHNAASHYRTAPYPVLLWNLRQMESGILPAATAVPSIPAPTQVIRFSPNSDRLAVGRKDSVVRIYDLTPRGVADDPFILRGHQFAVTQIAFAPSGQWVATGSQDNTVRLWNLSSTKVSPESATLYGHLGWITSLTIDSTGEYLISGSYDRTIRIWNITRDRIGTALDADPIVVEANLGVLKSILLTRDGDKVIALGNEGSLGIYHFPSILRGDPVEFDGMITFRNSRLSISECLLAADDQLLIFSYDHLLDSSHCGIRLWPLQPESFLQ